MAKILNIRERVHQPYRDALLRTAGLAAGTLGAQTDLFIAQGRDEGFTNLKTSAILPNDSSMIILAARVMQWFRKLNVRTTNALALPHFNGDISTFANAAGQPGAGNATPNYQDVYRLHWQCAEGLFWTLGAGDKDSLKSMPSMYFPYGGGLDTIMGDAERVTFDGEGAVTGRDPALHLQNGQETHTAILRLARAITITPRQLIKVLVSAVAYPEGGNGTVFGSRTATGRNMMNPIDNLNAVDAVAKVVSLTIDGLLSRDVQ
jgi:hypothetical protein